MKLKEVTEEICKDCFGNLGIFWIQGGMAKYCTGCGQDYGTILRLENDEFKMPFGKHKGTTISDLPIGYLMWGAQNLKGGVSKRFQEEISRRNEQSGFK